MDEEKWRRDTTGEERSDTTGEERSDTTGKERSDTTGEERSDTTGEERSDTTDPGAAAGPASRDLPASSPSGCRVASRETREIFCGCEFYKCTGAGWELMRSVLS